MSASAQWNISTILESCSSIDVQQYLGYKKLLTKTNEHYLNSSSDFKLIKNKKHLKALPK